MCESSTVECERKTFMRALALLMLSGTASLEGNNKAGMLFDFEFSM